MGRRQWGEGSIDYIAAKGIWRWRGYYRDPITGVCKRKEITAKERKTLRAKIATWQDTIASGQCGHIKVKDWAIKWLYD